MQTVLVVGATGNIGASASHELYVLVIVRNKASAEKLFKSVGTREGITTVEADIMSTRLLETSYFGSIQTAVGQDHSFLSAWPPSKEIF